MNFFHRQYKLFINKIITTQRGIRFLQRKANPRCRCGATKYANYVIPTVQSMLEQEWMALPAELDFVGLGRPPSSLDELNWTKEAFRLQK